MGLGMPEVVLILVIALIVFGPRKLPELGKSLGQAMAQFRKASDDFKRTWEQEVELESTRSSSTSSIASSSYDNHGSDPYPYEDSYSADTNDNIPDSTYETAGSDEKPAEAVEPATTGAAAAPAEKQRWI
ncbi:MAG: TatA/E family twin arginine-targeting protein translocase [Blastocatellales bacterium]